MCMTLQATGEIKGLEAGPHSTFDKISYDPMRELVQKEEERDPTALPA